MKSTPAIAPEKIIDDFKLSASEMAFVAESRQRIAQILNRQDDRLLVVVGPCSIHDKAACFEYAEKLLELKNRHSQDLEIVMRAYFEKPRTTVGWKGLINDPQLDGSYDIEKGLRIAREILLSINQMGLPAGTEFLDLLTPLYLEDLVAWAAIGARTTESQSHRQMVSALKMPVGFKNNTSGDVDVAINAIKSASTSHTFLTVDKQGSLVILQSDGNLDGHVILRGGQTPNYDQSSVVDCVSKMHASHVAPNVVIDFSHANSSKQFKNQLKVSDDVSSQISKGNTDICGVMIESHILEGNQPISNEMKYGKSITDACLGFDDTALLIEQLSKSVQSRRSLLSAS